VLDCLKPITHKKLIEHELEGDSRAAVCSALTRWLAGPLPAAALGTACSSTSVA
jgi:hypothetical protein